MMSPAPEYPAALPPKYATLPYIHMALGRGVMCVCVLAVIVILLSDMGVTKLCQVRSGHLSSTTPKQEPV